MTAQDKIITPTPGRHRKIDKPSTWKRVIATLGRTR